MNFSFMIEILIILLDFFNSGCNIINRDMIGISEETERRFIEVNKIFIYNVKLRT